MLRYIISLLLLTVSLNGCNKQMIDEAIKDTNKEKVMILTESNFNESIKEGVCLVDFWAPWCGPCNMLTPTIESVANKMEGKAVVAKVNIDEESSLATKYEIQAIPALCFFKDGEVVEKWAGVQTEEKILSKLEELLKGKSSSEDESSEDE